MGVRAFLVLGVVLVSLLVISSEVAARELAGNHEVETKRIRVLRNRIRINSDISVRVQGILDSEENGGVEEGKYGGNGGYGGSGGGGYGQGGGGYGGGGRGGGGYGGGGGHCQRCCRYGNCHCCTEAEIAAQEAEAKPHN